MALNHDPIRKYFTKLGLQTEIADVYLALHTFGPQGMSQLARNSKIERTKLYRLVDQLLNSHLIEVEMRDKRALIKAAPIANLNILIAQKEHDLRSLQDDLTMVEQLLAHNTLSAPAVKIRLYQDAEGVEQTLWNASRSKTIILCVLSESLQSQTNKKFFETWIQKCNDLSIQFRALVGDSFLNSQTNKKLINWEQRQISKSDFQISHNIVIYDDVVVFYIRKNGQVFGTEIDSPEIASSQRQFFNLLFNRSANRSGELP